MQRAMRIVDNPALDVAIEAGNLLGLPVVVYFQVIPNYPNANLRHYHFLAQGCGMWPRMRRSAAWALWCGGIRKNSLEAFLEEVQAALLIGDENPCREPERWRQGAGQAAQIALLDRGCRCGGAFAGLRPQLCAAASLPAAPEGRVAEVPGCAAEDRAASRMEAAKTLRQLSAGRGHHRGFTKLDRSVRPVDSFTGGTHAALKRLGEFRATSI